jgi:high-affinity Fe2+/Pb2+ permease
MGSDYFSVPIFFIIFRETTEAAVIVSVLLSFLSQVLPDDHAMRKRLARQVQSRHIQDLLYHGLPFRTIASVSHAYIQPLTNATPVERNR